MANTKISELGAAGAITGTELVPVVQGGVTKRTTASALSGVRGSLGYAQATATQGSITTETDLTGLTVTATVNSGERIRVKGNILVQTTVAGDVVYLRIKESTTVLQISSLILSSTADVYVMPIEVILTPSAASHTYKLSLARQGGTGTISMVAGATFPSFILVEGIGT